MLIGGEKGTVTLPSSMRVPHREKRRNRIKRLRIEDGRWMEESDLCGYITSQYTTLFHFQGPQRLEELINTVERNVSPQMNEFLIADFTEEEVNAALNGIGDIKAPGPDGMPAIFFKKYWELIGSRVKNEVLYVLNGGAMPDGWNNTNVVLIPKVKEPKCLKDL
jgi:hypothetical protein